METGEWVETAELAAMRWYPAMVQLPQAAMAGTVEIPVASAALEVPRPPQVRAPQAPTEAPVPMADHWA